MSTGEKAAAGLSRREQNKAERRDVILAAAARLFGRGSYDKVQMDDVAVAAGIGKPALYRYFPSKEDLFLEVSDRALGELQHALGEVERLGLPPEKMLARMVELLVDALRQHFASLRLLSGEHPVLADRWRVLFRGRRRAINASLADVLRRGAAAGEFRAVDPVIAPGMIIGMIRGAVMEAPDIPNKRLAEAAIPLVLGGVSKTPASQQTGSRRRS
ncbi:MAG: TetR/AcrR family transcriptional regulator [Xanthobacteraceae bacterium]|nr:TetR/AcrR family transcriptional regulator [Xanthobacteraceae bacterium]